MRFVTVLVGCLVTTTALAAPFEMSHQGRVLDAAGGGLEGTVGLTFALYNNESGGSAVWSQAQTVSVSDGYYSAVLGPLDDALLDETLWLELRANDLGLSMARQAITPVPLAVNARQATSISGGEVDASLIKVNGDVVIDGDGNFVGGGLGGLECPPSQIAVSIGDHWICATPASTTPAGTLTPYAGIQAPAGYLIADGADVSRDTYSDLFAAIGTTWGAGDGSTTFTLPNLQGRLPIGAGQLGATDVSVGDVGGRTDARLVVDNMPSHDHNFRDNGHGHNVVDSGHGHSITDPGHGHTGSAQAHSHPVTDPGHGHSVSDPGHAHGISDPGHSHSVTTGNNTSSGPDNRFQHADPQGGSWGPASVNRSTTGISVQGRGTGISIRSGTTGVRIGNASPSVSINGAATGVRVNNGQANVTVANGSSGVSLNPQGASSPVDLLNPYAAVNWLIKI